MEYVGTMISYILRPGPASKEKAENLSVLQCPRCKSLVVEDFMPDHIAWHIREGS